MGPSRSDGRRVVFVLMDGARHDVLHDLLDRGELPNLARWVIEPGGITVATTVFPSTTGVAYIPFLFGRYPGPANVPGARWLDRTGAAGGLRAQWRAARSYCGVQASWINRGLARGASRLAVRRAILGIGAHFLGTHSALDRAVADSWIAAADEAWRF